MYLVWTSDLSPYLTDSAASRMVMAIIPAERYIMHPITGVNLTLQAACLAIAESFNRLSREDLNVCDLYSGETVPQTAHYIFPRCRPWKIRIYTRNKLWFKTYDCTCTALENQTIIVNPSAPAPDHKQSRLWNFVDTSHPSEETGRH